MEHAADGKPCPGQQLECAGVGDLFGFVCRALQFSFDDRSFAPAWLMRLPRLPATFPIVPRAEAAQQMGLRATKRRDCAPELCPA
jgi:hypothetical protein